MTPLILSIKGLTIFTDVINALNDVISHFTGHSFYL